MICTEDGGVETCKQELERKLCEWYGVFDGVECGSDRGLMGWTDSTDGRTKTEEMARFYRDYS